MGQSRKHSVTEAAASTIAGFAISLVLTYYVLPLWGFIPSAKQALEITIVFTLASLIRGYAIRRVFNKLTV